MNTEEKINELEKKIENNYNEIISNMKKLHSHEEKINRNTGAIEVLHTIKSYNNRFFFIMMYNDYFDLVKDNEELALKLAKDWLDDIDAKDNKLYCYWKYIVK